MNSSDVLRKFYLKQQGKSRRHNLLQNLDIFPLSLIILTLHYFQQKFLCVFLSISNSLTTFLQEACGALFGKK